MSTPTPPSFPRKNSAMTVEYHRPSRQSIQEYNDLLNDANLHAAAAASYNESTLNQLGGGSHPQRNMHLPARPAPAPPPTTGSIYNNRRSKLVRANGHGGPTSPSSRSDRDPFASSLQAPSTASSASSPQPPLTPSNGAPPRPSRANTDMLDLNDLGMGPASPPPPADGFAALDLASTHTPNVLTRPRSNTAGTKGAKKGGMLSFMSEDIVTCPSAPLNLFSQIFYRPLRDRRSVTPMTLYISLMLASIILRENSRVCQRNGSSCYPTVASLVRSRSETPRP